MNGKYGRREVSILTEDIKLLHCAKNIQEYEPI